MWFCVGSSYSKTAVTHNEISESIPTVKKRACLFHWISHWMHWNTSMSCKAIVPKTAVIVFLQWSMNETCKVFFITESLKLGHRYLISMICIMLLFLTKDEHKVEHKTIFKTHVCICTCEFVATAEGYELRSLSVWIRHLTDELFVSYFHDLHHASFSL